MNDKKVLQEYIPPIKLAPDGYLDENGNPKALKHLSEGITTLDETFEENNYQIKRAWRTYSPRNIGQDNIGRMAYVPETSMRKSESRIKRKKGNKPYWILALNKARDQRPKTEDTKSETDVKIHHCKLCKNILETMMAITKIGNYHITPNGFPYFDYAFLGIDGSTPFRAQTDLPRPEEIETWGKICAVFNLAAFFNPPGAGASIYEHQHVQLFEPRVFKLDGKLTPLPLFNEEFTEEIPVRGDSSDVFYVRGYPIPTLMFLGYNAPDKVANAAHLARELNFAFNIEVLIADDQEKFYFQLRNPANETSICMKRKCGGLEMMGVALLGDIEERSGERNITTDGTKVSTKMSYNTMRKNLINASYPKEFLDYIAKRF
ncbi:hypothetical protein A3K73_03565 [Candidatus Pacearchaeota archaeon RBG_13_36_9]|nr:MAG: hypothetical protein A3K73_03565 [Candidatus Pacearchaeota archaeon RBG_13_36_9]HJX50180.1 hypothetical protein [Candidatus Nanoarchaeia archaeon]